MTPFVGFFDLAPLLASQRILGRMSDGCRAMPFKHLSCDRVDLSLRDHGALPLFPSGTELVPRNCCAGWTSLRTTELLVSFQASLHVVRRKYPARMSPMEDSDLTAAGPGGNWHFLVAAEHHDI